MPYFPADRLVPTGVQTPLLLLEPLKPQHVEIDHAAVIESRDQLRLWSGSSWPADDFTIADNLKDLEYHWREHQNRTAFTYTVLDPAREACLGCIYMRPISELDPYNPVVLEDVAADETLIRFWVRTSNLDGALERHLLDTLISWLRNEWSFARTFFETRKENIAQKQLFASYPLQPAVPLQMPDRGGYHLFFEM